MIKHMKLGDMPQFCETVKAWLNERYGEEQGAAIWRATAAQYDEYLKDLPDYGGKKANHALAIYGALLIFSLYPLLPDQPPVEDLQDTVLVLGFGRFSQIVCQTLLVRGISVSVIDRNIENIRTAAKFGFKVYYGDGIRLDVLHAAGIEKAKCVVIGINDTQRIQTIVHQLKQAYPNLPILTRTYDRRTAVELIKYDVDFIVRETFESALTLSRATLMQLGINKIEADDVIEQVRALDQERVHEEVLHGFSNDIARKYWSPHPFIKPHIDAEALNQETADLLAETETEAKVADIADIEEKPDGTEQSEKNSVASADNNHKPIG